MYKATVEPQDFLNILTSIDPIHSAVAWQTDEICRDVWKEKYAYGNEKTLRESLVRVCTSVYYAEQHTPARVLLSDTSMLYLNATLKACELGLFMPAGRILAGAGTEKNVTLMNCYVNSRVEDSMEGIMESLTHAAFTMQQGGGVGTCFSTIRPNGAVIRRLGEGSVASGPLPFMDMWNAMCGTIMSAGSRRGAMMATISDTHPDLVSFIEAKRTPGRLTNFNVSVLISDAFMEAVQENEDWALYFSVPPVVRDKSLEELDFHDENGVYQYVYSVWKARELWNLITRNSYEYSEPGVIFIDRINELNNLNYLENIQCTNPCGEQPLPPHGTCNLGAIVLSRMVKKPFTEEASFDFDMLRVVTRLGVRFLDNVIDVTNYPLAEQRIEEENKRRLGLGISGLADALAQLGMRYGSIKASKMARDIMRTIACEAYATSVELATLRGSFPLYKEDEYGRNAFVERKLPTALQNEIRTLGIRNSLLLTIAPTGTTSLVFGNISSGVEPTFAHKMGRKVLQADGSYKQYTSYSYIAKLYAAAQKISVEAACQNMPEYIPAATSLTVEEHIRMQAACQEWVDASVSKTINVAEDITFDDFVYAYELAYNSGCKGCTTYRPSAVRGSILVDASGTPNKEEAQKLIEPVKLERPIALEGKTYKVRWPTMSAAVYITINQDEDGKPYEMFFATKDARHSDWMTALTLMISGILRSGIDPAFVARELKQVTSMHDTAWIKGKFYASPVAYIGQVIEEHLSTPTTAAEAEAEAANVTKAETRTEPLVKGTNEVCPQCMAPAIIRIEGCRKCSNCTYSECG